MHTGRHKGDRFLLAVVNQHHDVGENAVGEHEAPCDGSFFVGVCVMLTIYILFKDNADLSLALERLRWDLAELEGSVMV